LLQESKHYLLVLVPLVLSLGLLLGLLILPPVVPVDDESAGAGVAGAIADDDGDAGAGVLTGAASLGALEVAGVGGVSSVFLQPARAANTTAVANTVLRIIIGTPFVVNKYSYVR
jgi:hypothetical protein